MYGFVGKILHVHLGKRKCAVIATSQYEDWGGGHGMGSAIFWDLVKNKKISAFAPANVVTIMTSPLCGTMVPGAAGRCEVQGIGPQSYPIEWFTRSNFGGRFSPMLKYAGWDGIIIEGKARSPVWIDIRDEVVKIRAFDHQEPGGNHRFGRGCVPIRSHEERPSDNLPGCMNFIPLALGQLKRNGSLFQDKETVRFIALLE